MEVVQVCINRSVDKTTMGHLHIGILLGRKKEEYFTLCNSTDGLRECYVKLKKPVKDKYHMISLMWNLMNKLK